jgi:hypothetical protein
VPGRTTPWPGTSRCTTERRTHVTTYERVVNDEVVERVTPIDGSHEDTRIGVLVLEGGSEWRVVGQEPTPAEPAKLSPTPETAAEPHATEAPSGHQNDEPASPATPDQSADTSEPTEEVDHGTDGAPGSDAVDGGGDRPRRRRHGS